MFNTSLIIQKWVVMDVEQKSVHRQAVKITDIVRPAVVQN